MDTSIQTLTEKHLEAACAVNPEACVYVHLTLFTGHQPMLVRIWPTTYLLDQASAHRSILLHAENISFAPIWTPVPAGIRYDFLLVFSGLPADCRIFDLVEQTEGTDGGAFVVRDINRNENDVYRITL
ncbi:MAG: hypothetical protein N2044_00095 [Cyclobacteriaceae bacterium]|nr:hypothetical protein [Cyclobacteriaceae bacterium]